MRRCAAELAARPSFRYLNFPSAMALVYFSLRLVASTLRSSRPDEDARLLTVALSQPVVSDAAVQDWLREPRVSAV